MNALIFIAISFKTERYTKQLYTNMVFNSLTTNVPHHIETSQLICLAIPEGAVANLV